MKKGIFGAWFRELATLVFTQTIQAFLLAIVMTIVISAMGAASTGAGTNYAAGMLAIIALFQFNKIEKLVKSIFGVTSAYGPDMDSGKGGLLAGMMALKSGKKVLNNVGKVAGGIGTTIKTTQQIGHLKAEKKALAAPYEEALAQEAMGTMEQTADKFIGDASKGAAMAAGAQAVGGTGGSAGGTGITPTQVDQLIQALKEQTSTMKNAKSSEDKTKAIDKMRELDQKIEEARKNRREGVRQIATGINETVAAVPGAAVGAAIGLGMGENVVQNAVIGAGVADSMASGAMRVESKLQEGTISVVNSSIDYHKYDKPRIKTQTANSTARIEQARNDKKVYDSVTKNLNKSMKNKDYMKNSTSQQRARVVKNLQDKTKSKYDASNM